MQILESVRILPDTGVTHETVALARKTGRSPGDWRLHVEVAGLYLHSKTPMPDRARRFFMSALDRAGSDLDPKSSWYIQEGMARAWLAEDNGEKAIPYLMRAREITDKDHPESGARSETLFNIACAYALTGETEKACNQLAECLSATDPPKKRKFSNRFRPINTSRRFVALSAIVL